jgi:hypothetical protein
MTASTVAKLVLPENHGGLLDSVAMIQTQRYAVYRRFPWKQQRRGPDGFGETRFSCSAVSRRQSLGRSLRADTKSALWVAASSSVRSRGPVE